MKNLTNKQIFVIALAFAFLVAGLLLRISWQKQRAPRTTSLPLPTPQAQATLSLEPSEATVKLGQIFGVEIKVDVENGEATGVEAILTFDPAFLEVLDGDKEEGIQAVELGFFDEYLGNKVDNQEGKIIVSGIKMEEQFNQGTIGAILFRAKKKGETEIKFIFAPGEKGESDVSAPGGEDILTKTFGGKFIIE